MARETTTPARSAPPPQKRATPLARRMALEHGIDLGGIDGTGSGGRIRAADVRALVGPLTPAPLLRASPPGPRAPDAGAAAEVRSTGQTVAEPPSATFSGSPVSGSPALPLETLTFEVDVTHALAAAAAARAPAGRQALPVGLAAVVTAEAAALLAGHPELNGAWGGELAVLRRRAHVALGEAGPEGLRWAVVADAGDLTARGVARAAAGGAGGEATFAVVSLAEGASWQSAAPPLPGTAAALSVGAPAPRLVCWGEGVAVRALATMTLSYDARLVAGRRAAGFLRALRERLEGLPTRGASARVL